MGLNIGDTVRAKKGITAGLVCIVESLNRGGKSATISCRDRKVTIVVDITCIL